MNLRFCRRFNCKNNLARTKKFEIKWSSAMYRLDPILDKSGLIRVGGRLAKSHEFPEDFKHPVILPKKSFSVDLIIRDALEKIAHAGQGITLSALRNHYGILSPNAWCAAAFEVSLVNRRWRSAQGKTKASPTFHLLWSRLLWSVLFKEGRKELKRTVQMSF